VERTSGEQVFHIEGVNGKERKKGGDFTLVQYNVFGEKGGEIHKGYTQGTKIGPSNFLKSGRGGNRKPREDQNPERSNGTPKNVSAGRGRTARGGGSREREGMKRRKRLWRVLSREEVEREIKR